MVQLCNHQANRAWLYILGQGSIFCPEAEREVHFLLERLSIFVKRPGKAVQTLSVTEVMCPDVCVSLNAVRTLTRSTILSKGVQILKFKESLCSLGFWLLEFIRISMRRLVTASTNDASNLGLIKTHANSLADAPCDLILLVAWHILLQESVA
jgi:hypothetical protein